MRRAPIAIAALVGACGSPRAPATSPSPTSPAPSSTSPAPSITWSEDGFDERGLPAIAKDGSVVAIAVRDNDGGRGFPNLHLELRDRRDALVRTIDVLAANRYETDVVAGKALAALVARSDAANAELAQLHGAHALVMMQALPVENSEDGADQIARADAISLRWRSPTLEIAAGATRTTRAGASWLAKPGARCAQCPPCDNPAYLAGAFVAPSVPGVALVQIGYRGTDTCWEPSDQFHVVTW